MRKKRSSKSQLGLKKLILSLRHLLHFFWGVTNTYGKNHSKQNKTRQIVDQWGIQKHTKVE